MSVYRVSSNKSSVNNFPTVRPTLDLDFANSKTLDPRITFTRSSGGSYVGADGLIKLAGVNEARFDHNPYTGESLGLLIEEARTNLLLRSEEFDSGSWTKTRSSITINAAIAPNGTTTASKLVEDTTASNDHRLIYGATFSVAANQPYTFSIFLKAAERSIARYLITGVSGTARGDIDLLTGTTSNAVPDGPWSTPVLSSVNIGNGWYKVTLTSTSNLSGSGSVHVFPGITNTFAYTGDGTSGIFIWGAQVEQGAFPTSYIPTEASTRTRITDNASITGKNFSDFYRPDEGTLYANARVNALGGGLFPGIVYVDDGTVNNTIGLFINDALNDDIGAEVYTAGVGQYNVFSSLPVVPNQLIKAITVYKVNDFAGAFNIGSNTVQTDASGSLPTVNRLVIGTLRGGFQYLNGYISRLTYYPKRLPNAQLQALTK